MGGTGGEGGKWGGGGAAGKRGRGACVRAEYMTPGLSHLLAMARKTIYPAAVLISSLCVGRRGDCLTCVCAEVVGRFMDCRRIK